MKRRAQLARRTQARREKEQKAMNVITQLYDDLLKGGWEEKGYLGDYERGESWLGLCGTDKPDVFMRFEFEGKKIVGVQVVGQEHVIRADDGGDA